MSFSCKMLRVHVNRASTVDFTIGGHDISSHRCFPTAHRYQSRKVLHNNKDHDRNGGRNRPQKRSNLPLSQNGIHTNPGSQKWKCMKIIHHDFCTLACNAVELEGDAKYIFPRYRLLFLEEALLELLSIEHHRWEIWS